MMRACLVLFALLLVSATIALGTRDPEVEQCRAKCESERHFDKERRQRCFQRCEEKQSRREGGDEIMEGRESEEEEEEQGHNPYVFEDRHFVTGMRTQHGRLRILQKFTDRSELLRGIENYRVATLEIDPQTFVVPSHWDADSVFFVARGQGTLTSVCKDGRESYNLKQGDIMRIKAGTTSYVINQDNDQRLILVKLIKPVNTPGNFEAFFGAGGENPESFYSAFSNEILEAAFNTKRDRLQRLFGQQKQGGILKASQEQIRAMSHRQEEGRGGESKGTFNIYSQRRTHSNQYGQLYVVDPSRHRQLQDLDIGICLVNITQGAMTAPLYNTKSTTIAVVVEGEGYFEMACPHLSSESQGSRRPAGGPSYQKVSTRLRQGTAVVIPAGHPSVVVASKNQNLQIVGFEINGSNNEKIPLAGLRNVINQLEREAKELAFGVSERQVDEVFRSQEEEFFFKGPRQQHQGRSDE
ncbi:hypothetical protein RD792_009438 [Penstemon davidsonii]|uniref:Cupin type-1 domain-containing protein n=1 Tax=Penstemon davidsonii TaxID=160366 RepID=A0ABR0D0G2_9LAMI|nr:hypothetical protein RD792_009438 [Penstemon davidsonii]